jgi:flagellar basal-body rod protein FlgB
MEAEMTGIVLLSQEARSLEISEARAALIAKNIANTNTPNYKAKDLNFQEAMQQATQSASLQSTHAEHLSNNSQSTSFNSYYRVPMQYSMDENTVDDEIERKNFIENSLRYQASLSFVESKGSSLIKAIRGE